MTMASFTYHYEDQVLCLRGKWTVEAYPQLLKAMLQFFHAKNADSAKQQPLQKLDTSELDVIDSSGASLLHYFFDHDQLSTAIQANANLSPQQQALMLTVSASLTKDAPPQPKPYRLGDGIAKLGEQVLRQVEHSNSLFGFIGLTLITFLSVLLRPWRWRVTSLVYHMQHSGVHAVPIIALLTFLVGAVVAFLGATVLQDFGATIYTVDLVAYGFMRELGVLLTAILLAGRTASAYTAQIGSMKVNQEIDAMRVQGLNPIELLVIPRLIALLIMLPILTFVAIIFGILGGASVALFSLDISSTQFLYIIQEIPAKHFWVGMSKAPIFAAVIAIIGCLEGFKVGKSATSVGIHTTSSVVQTIFIVILFDALAALFFMEMGW
ncbi:MAG: ABC transporter permease [Aliidiomarina sp.]|uniref:MlaE family ABC transporter permease n=1 Tax=Aliidiomarina sp. TaxID=1872439 RepID=UPI0025C20FB0|nr:ABC transporter permease [Aliidiomarina sp.]MCH8500407.1 ABC transporter permease [Aliidiomarina sp.]